MNFTAFCWFPRPCVGWRILFSLPALLILSLTISEFLPGFRAPLLLLNACLLCGVAVLAFLHAYRSDLIGRKTIWLSVLSYPVISITFWNFWKTDLLIDRVLFSALMIFTVLPFATIPLAVSWNRHR